jgi:hypothetical protein
MQGAVQARGLQRTTILNQNVGGLTVTPGLFIYIKHEAGIAKLPKNLTPGRD